jgi:hypothetical protein
MAINSDTAELIGILLGDGSISARINKKGQNRLKISFNSAETQYIDFVSNLILQTVGIKPILKFRKNENTADLFLFQKQPIKQILDLGLRLSPKRNTAKIPNCFLENDFELDVLRGYFDTDGSVVLTDNNGILYPRLEMKVCPSPMQDQFPKILQRRGFKFGFYDCGNGEKRIQMNGKIQLKKWIDSIGFHNSKHVTKANRILKN